MLSIRQLFLKHVAQTSESPLLLEVERAEGVYLFGMDGKRFIDLISGVSVSNVGHCHPRVIDAVNDQVSKYMHLMVYGEYVQYPQVRLAQRLAEILPRNLDNVYFVNSGSEAVEGALKLAKRYTGRSEIISFINAYHGSTHGALSVMGNEEFKRAFRPLLPDIKHIFFNSHPNLDRITSKTACVIVEPVQGEAGIISPLNGYLERLRERCSQTGTLLIFDEIQTGLGRTGRMFAFEKYQVTPDILLLAKAMGGGMPLGAFISSKEIMGSLSVDPPLGHITTFGGHPVSCAAALTSLEILIDQKLVEEVEQKAQIFVEKLSKHKAVKAIRYNGLFMAVEIGSFENIMKLMKVALGNGVILDWFLFCNTAFRIAPPLTISVDECNLAADLLLKSLDEI
ncbi:MAG: aspartate aminotransferase family protein [Bacteroidales bacterium]|nr:MAG: aspartate aminotransferase family protein [Bacteroidales bacterium]